MVTRRSLMLAGGVGLLAAHRLGQAQPAAPLRRVGHLSFASEAAVAHLLTAFRDGMQDLGWTEGKNVLYRLVYANGAVDRLDALAGDLIGQGTEVILASSPQAVRAAQRATRTTPIVMAGAANAVGAGFVTSLANPGGNITGFTSLQEEVLGKLIGVLHEVAPGARRFAVLVNESNPSHAVFWGAALSACAALDLVALRVVASAPAQFGAAVEQIVRHRAQAVVVSSDGMYFAERAKLQELMRTVRLPVAYALRGHVIAGGLLSYGNDLAANYRGAAKFVDKILKGARPADLPVEQTTKFELVINLATARTLGLVIPRTMLLRADEVIQ